MTSGLCSQRTILVLPLFSTSFPSPAPRSFVAALGGLCCWRNNSLACINGLWENCSVVVGGRNAQGWAEMLLGSIMEGLVSLSLSQWAQILSPLQVLCPTLVAKVSTMKTTCPNVCRPSGRSHRAGRNSGRSYIKP